MNNLRTVIKLNKDDTKQTVHMSELKAGDEFELYEDDVQYGGVWIAASDAYLTEKEFGSWAIDCNVGVNF